MPDVVGLPLEDAVALLEAAGHRIEAAWTDQLDIPPRTVVLQAPEGGTVAAEPTVVELVVAGPEPGTIVPDVLGLTETEARRRLTDLGIPVLVLHAAEPDPADVLRRGGLVWAQRPSATSPVDGRVTVWVNPQPVE
jgi:serine/threonine-protein kinase